MFVNGITSSNDCRIPSTRSRQRDLFELFGIYSLVLLVIWTPRPWQGPMLAVAALCTFCIVWLSYEGLGPMGLCTTNLTRSLWAVALAVVLAMAAVMLAGRLHTLHVPTTPYLFFRRYGAYIVWAGVQQLVLQCFFLSRALRLMPDPVSAAALSAGLFAIAHLPNPLLTVVTLICGLASCLFFVRYRNLWPLAIAHAILGVCIAITIPGSMHHNMRVGLGYLTYVDRSALPHAIPSSKPQRQN